MPLIFQTTPTGLRRTPPTRMRPSVKLPAKPASGPCRQVFATPSNDYHLQKSAGLVRTGPDIFTGLSEIRYFKGTFTMQRRPHSILRHSICLSLGACLLMAPFVG